MIDFNQILARVTILDILEDAGYHPPKNRMPCPLHKGSNKTSFSFTDSTFICHACSAKGGLLDLAQYLHHYRKQDAMRHLCTMAGISYEEKDTDSGPRPRVRPLPHHLNPLLADDEYREAKNRLEWLKLYHEGLFRKLRIIRCNVKQGNIPLEQFYPREEVLLYQLEELDGEVTYATYEVNRLKRKVYENVESP